MRSGTGGIASERARRARCATIVVAGVALVAAGASIAVVPGPRGVLGAVLALIVVAIAIADARYFIIPDAFTAAAFVLGLVDAAVQAPDAAPEAVVLAAVRGLVLALAFLGGRALYRRLRGWEGLGLGDVKLAGVAGAWLDWLVLPFAVEFAALAGLSYYVLRKVLRGRPMRARMRLPFGLFFAPAIWCCWLLQAILLPF